MKKKVLIVLILAAIVFTGCGTDKGNASQSAEKMEPVEDQRSSENEGSSTDSKTGDDGSEKNTDGTDGGSEKKQQDPFKDDFNSTLDYIKKNGGKNVILDLSVKPELNGRKNKYSADPSYKDIEERLADHKLTRVRAERKDNGTTVIVDVFRNRETDAIEKIVSTEIGSLRRVSGWYFRDGDIIYEYRYNDDIYGTNKHREEYSLTDDSEEVMNEGYITYDAVKNVPGFAKVYGYVGDEFGGVLENVYATIKSSANEYEEQVKSDGDGYYEFFVPVNNKDYYNITFTYGDFTPDSANDINITEGVTEYSCGIMYMAEDGKHAHDTDVYFMNINKKAPDDLKDGEYEAVLTHDGAAAELKPYFMSMSDGKSAVEETIRFTPDAKEDFKLFVRDEKNYGSNNMAYDMSKSDTRVTVYDKNGIAFCFNAPAVHAGVVWEVFEVKNGRILPVNNYYFETAEGVF